MTKYINITKVIAKFERGDHLTDREVEALAKKFGEVRDACTYVPRYAVVAEDAIHKQNRLLDMITGRKQQKTWTGE